MDKEVIARNFSRSAVSYDDHAIVQKMCAEKLIKLIGDVRFRSILEVGCGTGAYTRLLRDKYKDAEITAVDISPEMIKLAQKRFPPGNVRFMVADGEQMAVERIADLITSNASFQWFENLEAVIKVFAGALTDEGVLCFSIYGPETFSEFKEVLAIHFGQYPQLSSSKFACRGKIEAILEKYFERFELKEEHFTIDFLSFWDFLESIKKSGSRGEGLGSGVFLGKYGIKQIEKEYIDKFGSIIATHQVYFCRAELGGDVSPHPNSL